MWPETAWHWFVRQRLATWSLKSALSTGPRETLNGVAVEPGTGNRGRLAATVLFIAQAFSSVSRPTRLRSPDPQSPALPEAVSRASLAARNWPRTRYASKTHRPPTIVRSIGMVTSELAGSR